MKVILADENMSRLFAPQWSMVREKLHREGYVLEEMPYHWKGKSDDEIVQYIINFGYDGIITEDTDFFQTHRSSLLNRLLNRGKEVLVVRRVNPNSPRGEVRVYRYTPYGKEELFRVITKY